MDHIILCIILCEKASKANSPAIGNAILGQFYIRKSQHSPLKYSFPMATNKQSVPPHPLPSFSLYSKGKLLKFLLSPAHPKYSCLVPSLLLSSILAEEEDILSNSHKGTGQCRAIVALRITYPDYQFGKITLLRGRK